MLVIAARVGYQHEPLFCALLAGMMTASFGDAVAMKAELIPIFKKKLLHRVGMGRQAACHHNQSGVHVGYFHYKISDGMEK